MKQLLAISLERQSTPTDLERVRRNHHEAISELQVQRSMSARILPNIALTDGVDTPIAHGLGRPAFVTHSPPRGASASGRIEEVRDGTHDRAKYVVLKASGYGATVTVDLEVK